MTSGVYTITNIKTSQVYVGSSKTIEKRFQQHQIMLKKGEHHSYKLQEAWNECGSESFVLSILQEVEELASLVEVEQQFIDQYKSWLDYNVKKSTASGRESDPNNPTCPDCGKQSRHKRTNQNGSEIYSCTCGWSNSKKRIPRSPVLKRKEFNAIAIHAAIEFYSQDTCRGSFIDLAQVIGGDRWLYSCDQLVKDLKKLIEEKL
jgi:group I intron endonuclease